MSAPSPLAHPFFQVIESRAAIPPPGHVLAPENQLLLEAWVAWQTALNRSPRTISARLRLLRQFARETGSDIMQLEAVTVTRWLATKKGLATRAAYAGALRAWARWLAKAGYTEHDMLSVLDPPRMPKHLPRPMWRQGLAEVLRSPHVKDRVKAMIRLAAYAGLRVHEIAKVNSADFDLERNLWRIDGKGGKEVWLPLHPIIRAEAVARQGSGYWFPSQGRGNTPLQAKSVSSIISKAIRAAGYLDTPHSLRHWFGTELVRNGVDLRTTQELMRHENLNTTAKYVQVTAGQLDVAIRVLPNVEQEPPLSDDGARFGIVSLSLSIDNDVRTVVAMRQTGKTWGQISQQTGLPVTTARRRYMEATADNGK